jgi:sugar phosphate isomerase/epimerase
MMATTRRTFLQILAPGISGSVAGAAQTGRLSGLRIGVMDTTMRLAGKPEAVALAGELGFEGLQISIGRQGADGRLRLADPDLQARYQAEARKHKIRLVSTYLDILHVTCLKNDPLAKKWVIEGIEITRRLKAEILMLVFFGKCSLDTSEEIDSATHVLKELAPMAKRAGVVLGFENTLSAQDNARVLDRVGSEALKVYYDVGNATNLGGFDPSAEIRRLGRNRICQFHFKDKGYIGEGKVDFPVVIQAIAAINFRGFAVLETSSPSGSVGEDLRRNLAYTRRVVTESTRR